MKTFNVIIIGAGPAGIMAAITAAKKGLTVALLEKNETIGRKILATGNGRCNLTNKNTATERYHGASVAFVESVISQFDQYKTMEFFESLGVVLKEEDNGRIFPRSNQATTVLEALEHALLENGVKVFEGFEVKNIEKNKFFTVTSSSNQIIEGQKLIIATGGKAAHQLGSSGDGIYWAKKLGHNTLPVFAALAPLEIAQLWVKDVQGVKVKAKITSYINNKKVKDTLGDILFTHYGVSGPAVMAHTGALSAYVEDKDVTLELDLFPELSTNELDDKLEQVFKTSSKKSLKNTLAGLFPASLAPIILQESGINPDKKTAESSKIERQKIVATIKSLVVTVKKVRPLKEAQVSSGGVDTLEVSSETLESKIVPGLFFAGEVLDVDADSGGFNLQWAWSSGFVAGTDSP